MHKRLSRVKHESDTEHSFGIFWTGGISQGDLLKVRSKANFLACYYSIITSLIANAIFY